MLKSSNSTDEQSAPLVDSTEIKEKNSRLRRDNYKRTVVLFTVMGDLCQPRGD
ncbi:hypothetical protein CANTEDRAFT_112694 [Yamadazyma tenuis ATCC 10573]|uniref:Uncharacterized protein n=1 Tax=Candida tenuis (strain ATCC 10573 / BCRC 21748 / CBS 615 / JCM 9827 / NBRC 10315 / NRRL Y-1498 / VKM Y-70) TaxID=590646 RepID=G3AYE3_CANTC|nr:uncharacterized protein CANTEDRAFT_112694 [Yamadazyma tenuis ATCC 10573]EGV65833.1 hypothetical protein CANTEDRAFT_112694 [Yamadazyma tenuis ATCC 10573]